MVIPSAESCGIAFKEWASVCDALLDGRQTIILRKGGVSEGTAPGFFVPEHSEFWLYPTWVHQAEQGVREGATGATPSPSIPGDGTVPIRALVRVELLGYVETEESLPSLEEHHVLTALRLSSSGSVTRRPGLWVLVARVWRHEPGHSIALTPEHAGCKTWVMLEQPLATRGLTPVFDEEAWKQRRERLHNLDSELPGHTAFATIETRLSEVDHERGGAYSTHACRCFAATRGDFAQADPLSSRGRYGHGGRCRRDP